MASSTIPQITQSDEKEIHDAEMITDFGNVFETEVNMEFNVVNGISTNGIVTSDKPFAQEKMIVTNSNIHSDYGIVDNDIFAISSHDTERSTMGTYEVQSSQGSNDDPTESAKLKENTQTITDTCTMETYVIPNDILPDKDNNENISVNKKDEDMVTTETDNQSDGKEITPSVQEDISELVCFVCYKNIRDADHINHSMATPLVCICEAAFDCMEDLLDHKNICMSHLKMITNLKKFSCCHCKVLLKTKQCSSRHSKNAKHIQRMKEISAAATKTCVTSGTTSDTDSNAKNIFKTSKENETDMPQSQYNTRKSSRKPHRKQDYHYVDMVKKSVKRSGDVGKKKSNMEASKLIEDIKRACVELETLGKYFLLIISDDREPIVLGSGGSVEFAATKKKFIQQYSTFCTEKRSLHSKPTKRRQTTSNRKSPTPSKENDIHGTLNVKPKVSVTNHSDLMPKSLLKKEALIKLKRIDKQIIGDRRSKNKGLEMNSEYQGIIQKDDTVETINNRTDVDNTVQRVSRNLPLVNNTDETEDDDDDDDDDDEGSADTSQVIEDVWMDEDIEDGDYNKNEETRDGKIDLKSQIKQKARTLFKRWSDLGFGTAKHALKEIDSDDKKYVAVTTDLDLHICQKCGLYFLNSHHLKSHQSRITNCETRNFHIPQQSIDPLSTTVTIQNQDEPGKAGRCITLNELLEGQTSAPFECGICNKTFVVKSRLKRHIKSHSELAPFTCGICGSQIKTEEGLTIHLTNHFYRPFDCGNCNMKFMSLSKLEAHNAAACLHSRRVVEMEDGKPVMNEELKCEICGYQASNLTSLALHQSKHSVSNNIPCILCGKMVNKRHMKRHVILMHQDKKPFHCELCDKQYKDRVGFRRHVKLHQNETHTCMICAKTFTAKCYLTHHMHTHSDLKRYVCQHCGATYKKKLYLDNHMRLHTGERPYTCSVEGCEKSFRCRPNLKQHMRTHCEIGQFVCDICGRTFKQPGQLNHHRKSHSMEFRWPCAYCSDKFKSCWLYKRHLAKSHPEKKEEIESTTNIRLHKCTICDKIYHDTEDLHRHLNNHKGIKPFSCSYCGKGFSCKSNLRAHEHTHKGTAKLKCKICYKSFLQERNLIAHTERIHPDQCVESGDDVAINLQAYSGSSINQEEYCIVLEGLEASSTHLQVFSTVDS